MNSLPLVSQTIKPADSFLWTIKTYLDLISGEGLLTPGSGLKRLYVMSAGLMTFNDTDISAITEKAEKLKILPYSLRGFVHQSIARNLYLYGQELSRVIADRIVAIANGTVVNPPSFVTFNGDEGRRHFYCPPVTLIKRVLKALRDDTALHDYDFIRGQVPPLVTSLSEAAMDAELVLTQTDRQEGYATPNASAWGALMRAVEGLVDVLKHDARYPGPEATYKRRARHAVKILWVIAKLLTGDLTKTPMRQHTNLVDLDQSINLSDGTLAAIPFPIRETITLFEDSDHHGISMRGRQYLSAVSGAILYRNCPDTDSDGD